MADTGITRDALVREDVVSIRRRVNDAAAELAERFDGRDGSLFEFLCECGEPDCRGLVKMTLADYRIRRPGSVVGHG